MYFDGRHSTRISDLSYVCGCHGAVRDVHAGGKSATICLKRDAPGIIDRLLLTVVRFKAASMEDYLSICARDHEGRDCVYFHIGRG